MIKDFAIQLYSVRNEIKESGYAAVFEKLAAIGYSGVEFAGCHLEAAEMLSLLTKNNLVSVGAHLGLGQLEDTFAKEIAYHEILGTKTLTISSAPFADAGETRETARRLAALAPKVKAAGFNFDFHNHAIEFETDDGKYRLEQMMESAPDVEIQLDVFWASVMKCDTAAFIKKHASRINSLHIKQADATGECVDLDKGVLDLRAIIETALANGIVTFIHEQEAFSGDPFAGLASGFKYITG
jgi:sugar phosphate isomerase/epimerase